ncbi:hypothetical protein HanRHA438_Chr15g0707511 [Helianthus annuus]|nr:hypothetical protein HanRHA438_Chr15g0707511 [Helianthus annuus]
MSIPLSYTILAQKKHEGRFHSNHLKKKEWGPPLPLLPPLPRMRQQLPTFTLHRATIGCWWHIQLVANNHPLQLHQNRKKWNTKEDIEHNLPKDKTTMSKNFKPPPLLQFRLVRLSMGGVVSPNRSTHTTLVYQS